MTRRISSLLAATALLSSLALTAQEGRSRIEGKVLIPDTSIEQPEDIGVRGGGHQRHH